MNAIAHTARGPVEYRMVGSGPVVMVLSGGHCSRDTRLSHDRLASEGFTVLTPSRPGYDMTPPDGGRTAADAADTMAALLDALGIESASVIGISAGGPTAIEFARRHGDRTECLILESAVTIGWEESMKRKARLMFGRAEKLTWGMVRFGLRVMPGLMLRSMMGEFSRLDVNVVMSRMSKSDIGFVTEMLTSMRSGTGFLNDIEHRIDTLEGIIVPTLVVYSPFDGSVSPMNAARVARDVPHAEIHEVPADSHLIWIGAYADDVWSRRLEMLERVRQHHSAML